MKTYWFENAYLTTGWETAVKVGVTDTGLISTIETNASADGSTSFSGLAMPGFPNIHSHAFQRAMTGLSEVATSPKDTFWTWRKVMYEYAHAITPKDQQAIADQLYMEMLKAGYTSVAEFHYLHNQHDGQSFDNPAAMSDAIINAAEHTGIGLTHLPVLYMSSNFGNVPLKQQQSRFANSLDSFQRLLTHLSKRISQSDSARLGIAFHSLRAVPPGAMSETLTFLNQLDNTAPIHIHIAEQMLEVEESIRTLGKRPVEWLLENHNVDNRWCLVHATHLNDEEVAGIAQSGAVAGICPTTEANLGDGLFPMIPYLRHGGAFAIGSDSNTSVSPIEELRWLEYGQRLQHQRRNIIASEKTPHTAQHLVDQALTGGATALGRKTGKISAGYFADIIILDENAPNLFGKPIENRLDALIFSGNTNMVRDVLASGQWVVKNYRHIHETKISENYRSSIKRLQSTLS
jgi:formimidoylglutamate deiminase